MSQTTMTTPVPTLPPRQPLWKKILFVVIILFISIQLVPVSHDNPPVQTQPAWDSPNTREYFARACADCHSNTTRWPWYSHIAPVSWLVAYDVRKGRDEFNSSHFDAGESGEAAELLEKGKMPLSIYLWLHPEARLTEAEKQEFAAGLKKTFGEED